MQEGLTDASAAADDQSPHKLQLTFQVLLSGLPSEVLADIFIKAGIHSLGPVASCCSDLTQLLTSDVISEALARAIYPAQSLAVGRTYYDSWRELLREDNAYGGMPCLILENAQCGVADRSVLLLAYDRLWEDFHFFSVPGPGEDFRYPPPFRIMWKTTAGCVTGRERWCTAEEKYITIHSAASESNRLLAQIIPEKSMPIQSTKTARPFEFFFSQDPSARSLPFIRIPAGWSLKEVVCLRRAPLPEHAIARSFIQRDELLRSEIMLTRRSAPADAVCI
mmetsp:Transcript_42942/g.89694  ORF Transcript_42942/g.89694 Transcript_42942/m.89694 type:complete len:279 (+) Transcript_42942:102-938(+)